MHDHKAVKELRGQIEDYGNITTIFTDGAFKREEPMTEEQRSNGKM